MTFARSSGNEWTEEEAARIGALLDEMLGYMATTNRYGVCKVKNKDDVEWDVISDLFQQLKSSNLAQTKLMELTHGFYKRNLLSWGLCVQGGPPLDLTVALLKAYPNAAKEQDIYGTNALEYGIRNGASMDVIEAILKKCPSAANDCSKKMSVTDIIKKGGSATLIHYVLMAWPQAVDPKDFENMLILHHAIQNGAPHHTIKFLMESCPDTVREKDSEGVTVLRCGIAHNASSQTIKLILNASDEDDYGDLLLFYAIEKGAPVRVLEAISTAYPESLKQTNDDGMTVLHYGMIHGASRDTIEWISDAYPLAVKTTDHENKTPFYYAISNHYSAKDTESILKKWPDAAKVKDNTGMTALFYGIVNNLPVDIMQTILDVCPDSVKVKDKNNKTPLHCALENDSNHILLEAMLLIWPESALEDEKIQEFLHRVVFNSSNHFVRDLFSSCPELGMVVNDEGKTLLRHSLEKDVRFEIFLIILKAWPAAAEFKDRKGSIPLHFAIENSVSIEFIKSLLIACPESIATKDKEGKTPLCNALENNVSLDFLIDIIKVCPEIALGHDKGYQYTLLHYAIDKGSTNNAVEEILITCPELAKVAHTEDTNPLRYAIQRKADIKVIQCILKAWPEAAKVNDSKGTTDLHYGILMKAPAIVIETIFTVCPESAMVKDNRGKTALFHCIDLNASFEVVQIIYERYKPAAYEEDNSGLSPIRSLVMALMRGSSSFSLHDIVRMLQLFAGDLRDSFPLRCLFQNTKPQTLQCILCILGRCQIVPDAHMEDPLPIPTLDLNQAYIPGQNFLEMLIDLDSDEASNMFFQIKEQAESWDEDKKIDIYHTENPQQVIASFVSGTIVKEETWRSIADQAMLSSVAKLRTWGQAYGRLFGKFRVDKNQQPKYQSANCAVVLGTELVEHDGSTMEQKIAMKFLSNDDSFKKELEQRQTILYRALELGVDAERHIVMVEEAFTSNREFTKLKSSCCQVTFLESISNHIDEFKNVDFDSNNENNGWHVIVMKHATTNDLNDIVYHQNIAGKKSNIVNQIALNVAKNLKFLNEECHVMHGDVRTHNFLPAGTEGEYVTFGLENSSNIETSSDSLPLEQALAKASYQYDMWCFGLMLYELCTGKQLLQMDNREVKLYELFKVRHLTDQDISRKLNMISKDEEWGPLESTLRKVLKTNSADRPNSWNEILEVLDPSFATTVEAEKVIAIIEEGDGIKGLVAAAIDNVEECSQTTEKDEIIEKEISLMKQQKEATEIDEEPINEKDIQVKGVDATRAIPTLEANSERGLRIHLRNEVLKRLIDDMKKSLVEKEAEKTHLVAKANKASISVEMRAGKVSVLESKLSVANEARLKAEASERKMTKQFFNTFQTLGQVKSENRLLKENSEELSIVMEAKLKAEEEANKRSEELALIQKELSLAKEAKAKAEASDLEMTKLYNETLQKMVRQKSEYDQLLNRSEKAMKDLEDRKIAELALLELMQNGDDQGDASTLPSYEGSFVQERCGAACDSEKLNVLDERPIRDLLTKEALRSAA